MKIFRAATEKLSEFIRLLSFFGVYINSNYSKNCTAQKSIFGLINNQHNRPVSDIKMGCCKAGYNGCGWIAAYNALHLLGAPQKPADIIKHLELTGGIVIFGALGVNSIAISRYFRKIGVAAEYEPWPVEVDDKIKASCVGILEYMDFLRWHYVTIHYQNGIYTIYNEGAADKSSPLEISSTDEWIKKMGYRVMILITVKNKDGT